MKDTSDPANPYSPPLIQSQAGREVICNFCGQPKTNALIQAPNQDIFICVDCIKIAGDVLHLHTSWHSLIAGYVSLALGVLLPVLLAVNWYYGDAAEIGISGMTVGLMLAVVCLFYFVIGLHLRHSTK
jgi:hypothetical protein